MEKIVKITEEFNIYVDKYHDGAGYVIETDKNKYCLLIYNEQSCCENWGYATTNDNLADYIGAELLSIAITDDALNTTEINNKNNEYEYYGDTMFLTLETSKGKLQFVVYNEHNGYYSHHAYFIKNGKIIQDEFL